MLHIAGQAVEQFLEFPDGRFGQQDSICFGILCDEGNDVPHLSLLVHVQRHDQCCHAPVVQDPLRRSALIVMLGGGVYSPHVERRM